MAERWLAPVVVLMILVAGVYGFDTYYGPLGPTGFIINTAQIDCSETDSNDPSTAGRTYSPIYENGYETDQCVGNDLLEFYCGNDGPDARAVNCQNGCEAGACN